MSKDDIIKILEFIRHKCLCSYSSPDFCDCKYGIMNPKTYGDYTGSHFSKSWLHEQTGCPEMRDVLAILNMIPPEVFEEAKETLHRKTLEAFKTYSFSEEESKKKGE